MQRDDPLNVIGSDSRGAWVLVVDDDNDSRMAVAECLRASGCSQVVEAGDGRAALDILLASKESVPSVIVLDLEMPVMHGWELLAIVRSYHRLARIPVIIVSGRDVTEAHHVIAGLAFMRKPADLDKLVQMVLSHVRELPN
jgi:CheY-like chemotaxis protein